MSSPKHPVKPAVARLIVTLCAALAACASEPPAPPAKPPASRRHPPVKPAPAVPPPAAKPAPAIPPASAAPANTAPAAEPPAAVAASAPSGAAGPQSAANSTAEWQQLAPYRKNAFDVFSLTETQAGLMPAPGAVGVYAVASTRADRLRLRLAPRPDSPVRLAAGAYTVHLQLELTYTEQRACRGAGYHGEVEEISRKSSKSVRLLLAPQVRYVAETTLPLASASPMTDDDVSYTGVTLKVRRIVIAPARRGGK